MSMFTLIYHTYIHIYFIIRYDERIFIKDKKWRWKGVLSSFTPSGSSLPIKSMFQIWIQSHSHTTLHLKINVTAMCKGLQKRLDHDSLISMQDNFSPPPYSFPLSLCSLWFHNKNMISAAVFHWPAFSELPYFLRQTQRNTKVSSKQAANREKHKEDLANPRLDMPCS